MKTLFITIIILFSLSCFSQKLVNEYNRWSILRIEGAIFPYTPSYTNLYFKFSGDTIINTKTYKKLIQSGDSLFPGFSLYGCVREDSLKVYFWSDDIQAERLLYDFSLQPGDSTFVFGSWYSGSGFDYWDTVIIKVDSVNYLNYNGQYFKTMYVQEKSFHNGNSNLCGNNIWVEDFGGIEGGLIRAFSWCYIGIATVHKTLCYHRNDTLYYQNPTYNTCYYDDPNQITRNYPLPLYFSLSPNPASNYCNIKTNIEKGLLQLKLYSILGKEIMSINIENNYNRRISLSKELNDIVIYKVFHNFKPVKTGKIVIQKHSL